MRLASHFRYFLLLCGFILINSVRASAQYVGSCIDSFAVNPSAYCPTDFDPVCGCNLKTYRNICQAQTWAGVSSYVDGPCEPIALDVRPNPVTIGGLNLLRYFMKLKQSGDVYLYVIDAYGKMYYTRIIAGVQRYEDSLDFSAYPANMYFVIAVTNSYFAIQKVIKPY